MCSSSTSIYILSSSINARREHLQGAASATAAATYLIWLSTSSYLLVLLPSMRQFSMQRYRLT